jgi:hypothetical protein
MNTGRHQGMVLMIQNVVSTEDGKTTPVGNPATRIFHLPRLVINNGREMHPLFPLANNVIGSVMTTKSEKTNLAQQYVCVDENSGKLVHGYYNKALSSEHARRFEEHLMLCFKCQETILQLDFIFDIVRANREQWLGSDERSKIISIIEVEREE